MTNMTSTITYPNLCFEIHRYDNPDTYRFFYLEPRAIDHDRMNYRPFQDKDYIGIQPGTQNYCEMERHQVDSTEAQDHHRKLILAGYEPTLYEDLSPNLAWFTSHSQAPIEFHRGLDSGDPEVTKRVLVWARGLIPA